MTLAEFILDARKAVITLSSFEGLAVSLGLLDNAQAGYATAALGALTSVLVWLAKNVPPAKSATPADNGRHTEGS